MALDNLWHLEIVFFTILANIPKDSAPRSKPKILFTIKTYMLSSVSKTHLKHTFNTLLTSKSHFWKMFWHYLFIYFFLICLFTRNVCIYIHRLLFITIFIIVVLSKKNDLIPCVCIYIYIYYLYIISTALTLPIVKLLF